MLYAVVVEYRNVHLTACAQYREETTYDFLTVVRRDLLSLAVSEIQRHIDRNRGIFIPNPVWGDPVRIS